jgi:DNA-binding response OmpR family regulator
MVRPASPDGTIMPALPRDWTFLILEDEPLIRIDIEEMVREAGCATIAVDTLERAHAALAGRRPDGAILDALLAVGDTFALARELLAAGVAVIFVTGYAAGIPPDLSVCPVVEKPFAAEDLKSAMAAALAGG